MRFIKIRKIKRHEIFLMWRKYAALFTNETEKEKKFKFDIPKKQKKNKMYLQALVGLILCKSDNIRIFSHNLGNKSVVGKSISPF